MRPVNLIPSNERRGDSSVSRTGPIAYLLIGALVALLGGVSALVLTGNDISDQKVQLDELEVEQASEQARAESLAAYTQFRAVRESRTMTVASLADSRFDWERVIRELSLVLPPDVWLTQMTATATPEASVEGGADVQGRDLVPGPALEMVGCAPGQQAVARFVAIVRDIDGVTRVGLPSSSLPGDAGGSTGGDSCQTRDFIAQFEMVVAFDAAPAAASAIAPTVTAPTTPTTEGTTTAAEGG
jgi:Tfp pilus assembly protein PilN